MDGETKAFTGIVRVDAEGVTLQAADGINFVSWGELPESEVERLFPEHMQLYNGFLEEQGKAETAGVPEKRLVLPAQGPAGNRKVPPVIILGVCAATGVLFVLFIFVVFGKVVSRRCRARKHLQQVPPDPVDTAVEPVSVNPDVLSEKPEGRVGEGIPPRQESRLVNPMDIPENIPEPGRPEDVPRQATVLKDAIEYPDDMPEKVEKQSKKQEKKQQKQTRTCIHCGAGMEGSVLTCPSCGKLAYEFKDQDPA